MANLKKVNKPCEGCGVMMENVSPMKKYCFACAKERRNKQSTRYREAHRAPKTEKPHSPPVHNPYMKYCKGCYYYGGGCETTATCNYIFIVGHRRPCPPGKDCTVKKAKRKPRQRFDTVGR